MRSSVTSALRPAPAGVSARRPSSAPTASTISAAADWLNNNLALLPIDDSATVDAFGSLSSHNYNHHDLPENTRIDLPLQEREI